MTDKPYHRSEMNHKDKIISMLVNHFRRVGEEVILLESQMEGHPASEKSYLAAQPLHSIRVGNGIVELKSGTETTRLSLNPWKALNDFVDQHRDWMFGFLGYDLKNDLEVLTSENEPLVNTPDLYFFVPSFLAEIQPDGNTILLKGRMPEMKPPANAEFTLNFVSQIDKEDYLQKVRLAQQQIREGNFYEINLSHPLHYHIKGDSWVLYQKMKEAGPVPFASYISINKVEVCSASPERFIARKGNKVWSQPIKGTIDRSTQNGDEQEQIGRLLYSEKEKAENLMIVDLVRNDMSRIAVEGSVKVKNLFEIQTFQTVHQMVSTVECKVGLSMHPVDIIKSCFPMGSMTGAPKIAAMKAIDELENYKRGIYSGAIGYLNPEGDFDFNVVIRTAIIQSDKLIYPVGGAITSDSDPEQEWNETLIKARALTEAVN